MFFTENTTFKLIVGPDLLKPICMNFDGIMSVLERANLPLINGYMDGIQENTARIVSQSKLLISEMFILNLLRALSSIMFIHNFNQNHI